MSKRKEMLRVYQNEPFLRVRCPNADCNGMVSTHTQSDISADGVHIGYSHVVCPECEQEVKIGVRAENDR